MDPFLETLFSNQVCMIHDSDKMYLKINFRIVFTYYLLATVLHRSPARKRAREAFTSMRVKASCAQD